MDKLTRHVCQKYPDYEVLKNWATYYNQTGRAGLDEMIHAPVNNKKSMTNEEKKDKLKSVLLESYSEERMLMNTVTSHYNSLQQFFETIKIVKDLLTAENEYTPSLSNAGRGHLLYKTKTRTKYNLIPQ